MWEIEITTTDYKKSLQEEKKDTLLKRSLNLESFKDYDIVDGADNFIGKAISQSIRPFFLAILLKNNFEVLKNGKRIFCPLLAFDTRGGSVMLTRKHWKMELKVKHSTEDSLRTEKKNICSLCYDKIESADILQCGLCGNLFHQECLLPISVDSQCPACLSKVGTDMLLQISRRKKFSLDVIESEIFNNLKNCQQENSQNSKRITVILVGCGNVGSKLALELSSIGIRKIVLIDGDTVNYWRNSKCCSVFDSPSLEGKSKVDVIAAEVSKRNKNCEVIAIRKFLKDIEIQNLKRFLPALIVGAVDSRQSRQDLIETAKSLEIPLIDLAISNSAKQILARSRTIWPGKDDVDYLNFWSANDWLLMNEENRCGGQNKQKDLQVSSSISGALASTLGLTQIKKLLAGDYSDIGWEIRVDLNINAMIRCQLTRNNQSPNTFTLPNKSSLVYGGSKNLNLPEQDFAARRVHRIMKDKAALEELAASNPKFSFTQIGRDAFRLRYTQTPGLLLMKEGVKIWSEWQFLVALPPRYPLNGPLVICRPIGHGVPYHPNIKPVLPYFVCYGRFFPTLLLNELSRRLERIIILTPGAIMTDEIDSLNSEACQFARKLIRENKVPLSLHSKL